MSDPIEPPEGRTVQAILDASQDLLDAVSDELSDLLAARIGTEIVKAYDALRSLGDAFGRIDRV